MTNNEAIKFIGEYSEDLYVQSKLINSDIENTEDCTNENYICEAHLDDTLRALDTELMKSIDASKLTTNEDNLPFGYYRLKNPLEFLSWEDLNFMITQVARTNGCQLSIISEIPKSLLLQEYFLKLPHIGYISRYTPKEIDRIASVMYISKNALERNGFNVTLEKEKFGYIMNIRWARF